MAKRSRPPPTTYEPLALLGWNYSPTRKRALDEWNRRHQDEPPPSPRVQRTVCKFLIDNPFLIGQRYDRYILPILQSWWAKTKPPKRLYSGKEIAGLVDFTIDTERPSSQARAYQKVADLLGPGTTVESVKQNHTRYGKRRKAKRDKSR